MSLAVSYESYRRERDSLVYDNHKHQHYLNLHAPILFIVDKIRNTSFMSNLSLLAVTLATESILD